MEKKGIDLKLILKIRRKVNKIKNQFKIYNIGGECGYGGKSCRQYLNGSQIWKII